jgi:hypothetical protein
MEHIVATPIPKRGSYAEVVGLLNKVKHESEDSRQPTFISDNGTKIVRPLTLEETFDYLEIDYLENFSGCRTRMLNYWLTTCSAVVNKARSSKIKFVNISPELVQIAQGFSEPFIPVNYDDIDAPEFNMRDGQYNVFLTRKEMLQHKFFKKVIQMESLRKGVLKIISNENQVDNRIMSIAVEPYTETDQLRAMSYNYLDGRLVINGRMRLDRSSCLAEISEVKGRSNVVQFDQNYVENHIKKKYFLAEYASILAAVSNTVLIPFVNVHREVDINILDKAGDDLDNLMKNPKFQNLPENVKDAYLNLSNFVTILADTSYLDLKDNFALLYRLTNLVGNCNAFGIPGNLGNHCREAEYGLIGAVSDAKSCENNTLVEATEKMLQSCQACPYR